MIASSTASQNQSPPQSLQNALTAEIQATEQSRVAATLISSTAVNEFALQFSSAMIEMLAAQGVPPTSSVSKRLKSYAVAGVTPVTSTSRFV